MLSVNNDREDFEDDLRKASETANKISANIKRVIKGNDSSIRRLLSSLLAGGHVLVEDVPGTGKTTLAKSLAISIESDFKRIQFTPDVLPSDILGVSIFDPNSQSFSFRKGPIFTEILLADEINRASPRTQSALLEVMGEGQISVDGERYIMNRPFMVIATQNPIEFHGTYPLPEAQMDRFAMRISLGYITPEQEMELMSEQVEDHPLLSLSHCVKQSELIHAQDSVKKVRVSREIKQYIVDIVAATRQHANIQMGASPRASVVLMKCAQAVSLMDGKDFVSPEAIQELAGVVISHRVAVSPEAKFSGTDAESIVQEIIRAIPVPV